MTKAHWLLAAAIVWNGAFAMLGSDSWWRPVNMACALICLLLFLKLPRQRRVRRVRR